MERLTAKIVINGKILVKTGLHIGGSKTTLDIGGVDLNVVKTPHGVPFIPGSSLKGKMRSLLARKEGSLAVKNDSNEIIRIFGYPADKEKGGNITRLIVRDAFLDTDHFKNDFTGVDEMDFDFSETKWENVINRKTGTAEHPRQIERVPADAMFRFEMVYDVYDNDYHNDLEMIIEAMTLLSDDYLGGQGSRGYGKIEFREVKFEKRTVEEYYSKPEKERKAELLEEYALKFPD